MLSRTSLLVFHTSLVLAPQPSVVVFALASLLTSGELERAIEHARKQEGLTDFVPELISSFVTDEAVVEAAAELGDIVETSGVLLSDKEVAEAVVALGGLVQKNSVLLVNLGELCWELSILASYIHTDHAPYPPVTITMNYI